MPTKPIAQEVVVKSTAVTPVVDTYKPNAAGPTEAQDPPGPECGVLTTLLKRKVLEDGRIQPLAQLNVTHSQYIFRFNKNIKYAHMATIEKLRTTNGESSSIVAAWQAAPPARYLRNPPLRMAVEGLPEQRIWMSVSNTGGHSWMKATKVPIISHAAVWSPVLHCDKAGTLWLFYAESTECIRPSTPPTWEPGGDIKVITMADPPYGPWSPARTLLQQETDNIPKVIANKLLVLSTGEWILPFWRERPSSDTCPNLLMRNDTSRTSCGVLISINKGDSWRSYGAITDVHTQFLEPALVELPAKKPSSEAAHPTLMMFFRTDAGCVFQSSSKNKGHTWSTPVPMNLPNPNTKIHAVRLMQSNMLAVVYNNHKRTQDCRACRNHLHVAVSRDRGATWIDAAVIENEEEAGVRIHYPTALALKGRLLVVYSRFYLGRELGMNSNEQGIRIKELDLDGLMRLPQLHDVKKSNKTDLDDRALRNVVDHFLESLTVVQLRKFRDSRWHSFCTALAGAYDLGGAGLQAADRLRRKKKLADYANDRIRARMAALGAAEGQTKSGFAASWTSEDSSSLGGVLPRASNEVAEVNTSSTAEEDVEPAQVELPPMEEYPPIKPGECGTLPCCSDFGANCRNMNACKDIDCMQMPCCDLEATWT
ncbi:hypothetical protein CYMTET_50393 [Cymbomonas tetramitiformis]|uniref:Sialidase domain-containing protein n=2 Tax=Cymbomonas tetramitiformis TaxID=36881 RepID=A0AAE0BN83_9CHLO|nr:hypothetical protein CYMTET_50393 [Cymbomonas tetramitiformis]